LTAGGGLPDYSEVILRLEDALEALPEHGVVVTQQHAGHGQHGSAQGASRNGRSGRSAPTGRGVELLVGTSPGSAAEHVVAFRSQLPGAWLKLVGTLPPHMAGAHQP